MVKRISSYGAFVLGAKNSAIYNFETHKVYSLNEEATKILLAYFENNVYHDFLHKVERMCEIETLCSEDYIFVEPEMKLKFAWLEVTQRCNSRCIHCYEGQEHEEVQNPLTEKEWISIIDDLYKNNCRSIQFIGGEPSIVSFLPHLIWYASEIGFDNIALFSNLQFVGEELKAAIIDTHTKVKFSIYGATSSVHDRITMIEGSFERLLQNVEYFSQGGIELTPAIVIMRENEGEYPKITRLLKKMGFDSFKYDEIRKVYGGNQHQHEPKNKTLQIKSPNFRTDRDHFEKAYYHNTCWNGKMVISTNGDIYPCEFERNICYGNIRENSIETILHSEKLIKHWSLSFNQIEHCKDCEYRFACKDCRPIAFAERGCLSDKNPRCRYNVYEGVWE